MANTQHWDAVYDRKTEAELSWHQDNPDISLDLMAQAGLSAASSVIDIGGGTARIVDSLLARGLADVSVLDLSASALKAAQQRLGPKADTVTWITADIAKWHPGRRFDIWHDRAVLHFLTDAADRAAYVACLSASLPVQGHAIIATFAPDGPEKCSGLPVVRYSPESLSQMLGADFALLDRRSHLHQTPWGSPQSFQYSLLRKQR